MHIKITDRTPERLQATLERILNIACTVIRGGYIPTQRDIDEASTMGRWWAKDSHVPNKIQLYGIMNDHWAHIFEKNDEYILLGFNFRYDGTKAKVNALYNLLLTFYPDNIEAITD